MPRIAYVTKEFAGKSAETIAQANRIISEYALAGFDLTLRQLYYQFVARGLIPNSDREYKRLGSVINDGRLAGLIDWHAIVDRTRNVRGNAHWLSCGEIIESCSYQFRYDKWSIQPNRVEVWIEKDALVGVIDAVCRDLDVQFFSCRGYTSQSEMWGAARRLKSYEDAGQATHVVHLGDHDPSGVDMTRDIAERLHLFGSSVEVHRIALNMPQVRKHNPPPNPAKLTDSRCSCYVRKYGAESWELDALEPQMLVDLVRKTVEKMRDVGLWAHELDRESQAKADLAAAAKSWPKVVQSIRDGSM